MLDGYTLQPVDTTPEFIDQSNPDTQMVNGVPHITVRPQAPPAAQPTLTADPATGVPYPTEPPMTPVPKGGLIDTLTGAGGGERYQLFPERLVRSALSLPSDVMEGRVETPVVPPSVPISSDVGPTDEMVQRSQDMAALAGVGGMPMAEEGALGMAGGRLKTVTGPVESDPAYVYHATNAERAADIAESGSLGLHKPGDFTDQDVWPDGSTQKRNYFTPTAQNTWQFAPEEGNPVLLRIPKDKHPFKRESTGDLYSTQPVPSSKIEALTGDGWQPLTTLRSDTSQPGIALAAAEKAPPFYSAVENAVQNAKLQKGSLNQWTGYLKNQPGIKGDELDWLNLDTLPQTGLITKEQLASHIADNKVQPQEVWKGRQHNPNDLDGVAQQLYGNDYDELSSTQKANVQQELFNPNVQPTKFGHYMTPPGGENYREMLLTLPDKGPEQMANMRGDMATALRAKYGDNFADHWTDAEKQAWTDTTRPTAYRVPGAHAYGNTASDVNRLAHVFMDDRTIDGGKSLNILENQSDWHSAGNKMGYANENTQSEFSRLNAEYDTLQNSATDLMSEIRKQNNLPSASEAIAAKLPQEDRAKLVDTRQEAYNSDPRYNNIIDEMRRVEAERNAANPALKVPDAPFKNSWPALVLKRVLKHAIDNDYDSISWVNGDTVADRYDLSKQIKSLQYQSPKRDDGSIGRGVLSAWDHKGNNVINQTVINPEQELPDLIGKEAAEKLLAQKPGGATNTRSLEGLDLKVGGEFHRKLYDDVMKREANALGKKYGAKVETKYIDTPSSDRIRDLQDSGLGRQEATDLLIRTNQTKKQPVHYMKITPAMRDAIRSRGFPTFKRGGRVPYRLVHVYHDPFKIERAHGGRVEAGNINHEPTEAQKKANNYAHDKISLFGLKISIENAKGSERKGVDKDGAEWKCVLPHHYGYVLGTEAKDGDHVDCCIGPYPKSKHIYVIDQINHETGVYDEAKCMLCFANEKQAVRSYKAAFSDGKGGDRIGKVTEVSIPEFKQWLSEGNTKKPYAPVNKSRRERVAEIVSRYGVQAA